MCLKQKDWSKRGIPANSTRCPDHLSRQFLSTTSTFPYSSKNSSAEHIDAFYTWFIITNTLTHLYRQTTHTHTYTHTRTLTHTHAHRHMYKNAWICLTEEFLEVYGKVEAVVRNCLLRWSGLLFEVTGTHRFDQCFCFKHISLFCAPIGAFIRWYLLFLATKDYKCRSEVTLIPCI